MKRLSAAILALVLFIGAATVVAPYFTTTDLYLEGAADADMLHKVQAVLRETRGPVRITLLSPGGPVVTMLEIAKTIRDASDAGRLIETRATSLCASGCTFILAAGTPGHRTIAQATLFFVHPPQVRQSIFEGPSCIKAVPKPTAPEDKLGNTILQLMQDAYIRYTGKPAKEVAKWLTCGKEQAGTGTLAVKLGMVDRVER